MKIQIIILGFFLFSCASNEIEDQTANIKNEDFKTPPKVYYQARKDYYKTALMKEDVLSRETIARFDRGHLGDLKKSSDELEKAVSLCYLGKYEEANEEFSRIYRRFAKNPSYWNQLGTCYYQRGEFSKANLYYLKALDYKKKYVPAINNIGVIYYSQGQEQKALAAFQRAMSISPNAKTPKYNLAQIYLKYGMNEKARIHLVQLYNKNKKDIAVIAALATSYLMEGSLNKALSYYSSLKEDDFEKAPVGLNYAVLLKMLGRTKDAKKIVSNINKKTIDKDGHNYYNVVRRYVRD